MIKIAGLISIILFVINCGPNTGTITITNPILETANVTFNGKSVALAPEQHFTQKNLKFGEYEVKIGTTPPLKVKIEKGKTTLVDIGGDNCFAVADYTGQYGEGASGDIKILEKFVNETVLTTKSKVTTQLGEQLPQNMKGHKQVIRLHRIDCSWIDNDQAIIDAIANLP